MANNLEKGQSTPTIDVNTSFIARVEKHNSYPDRASVELGTTWENLDHLNYHPPYFVSPTLIGKDWADPEDLSLLNKTELPLNPRGPTGLAGRGILGKWGANFAADLIVTRINSDGFLELISIKRSDCGLWALPGGMVDQGERITTTLSRELGEESSADLNFDNATPIYQGYVNDPRNTDNAWMETDAYHLHLSLEQANQITLKAQDDAADAKWLVCSQDNLKSLYANHSDFVDLAISNFQKQHHCSVLENGRVVSLEKNIQFPQVLVIGRFQPLCNHHVAMLQEVVHASGAHKLLLGLGVSPEPDDKNFLSFDERKNMVIPILDEIGVEYEIRPVIDIHNPPKYGAHVESIFPEMNESNTQIFTENSYTRDCFIQYGHNYNVVSPTIQPSKATNVRHLMIESKDWTQYVPEVVAKTIRENNYIDRLIELRNQEKV